MSLAGAPWNIPANAVIEVIVKNGDANNELWGGVRAVGSTLERRFLLQEAEDGGSDRVTMHVQTDASSQIQHYSDNTTNVTFILPGYWASGTYVERFDTFTAGASASWQDRNLCAYGVRPGYVAEIVMANDDATLAREAGVRTNGSALQRRLDLRNAEAGGVDTATMFVKADTSANATVELYAEDDADVDFYLVGSWSVAPLAYTELFVDVGSPALDATWTDLDLTASGVPDGAVAEFVFANKDVDEENNMGVRINGSALANRSLALVEAEDDGSDLSSMHVLTDGTATIEFYHSDVSDLHTFSLVGYWSSCDTSISYAVTDLGAVTAANSSLGWHINGSEKVAGFEEDSSGNPAGWLLSCGTFTSIGTLGGSYAEAHGVNDSDMVVGWAHNASGKRRAFRWTSGGGMVDLGTVSGRTDSGALSVNSSSEIVGTVLNFGSPPYNRLAFLYLPSTAYGLGSGMNSLGTLGGTQSVATDINNSGRVVGGAQNAGGNFRPFRWDSGTMTDLGTLGGDSTSVDHRAEAVNSSGNVAGRSYTAGGDARAFYWNGATMSNLGVLTGGSESWAFGLNDSNVVVGTSDVTGGQFHAFVWDGVNGLRDLNNLISGGSGWTLIRATDVNNEGFITGWGFSPTGVEGATRAFLLTPSCSAGGGGAVAAVSDTPLSEGFGVIDQTGTYVETAVGVDGASLAEIVVAEADSGATVEYAVRGSEEDSLMAPESLDGFAEGVALSRTLEVKASMAAGTFRATVSLATTASELVELGVSSDEVELHVLDPAQGPPPGRWIPAGKNIGESGPTDVLGESGFVVHADGTIDYWAVRDSFGIFAVGKAAEDASRPANTPHPTRSCGIGMLPPLLLVAGMFLGWLVGRESRRTLT